jgi:hypothetical protein
VKGAVKVALRDRIRLSTVILAVLFLASVSTYLLVRPPDSIAGYTPPPAKPTTPGPTPSKPRPSPAVITPSPQPSPTSPRPSRTPTREPSPTATTGSSAPNSASGSDSSS